MQSNLTIGSSVKINFFTTNKKGLAPLLKRFGTKVIFEVTEATTNQVTVMAISSTKHIGEVITCSPDVLKPTE